MSLDEVYATFTGDFDDASEANTHRAVQNMLLHRIAAALDRAYPMEEGANEPGFIGPLTPPLPGFVAGTDTKLFEWREVSSPQVQRTLDAQGYQWWGAYDAADNYRVFYVWNEELRAFVPGRTVVPWGTEEL